MPQPKRWRRRHATMHLEALAAKHDINIRWLEGSEGSDWTEASAYFKSRTVRIPKPWSARLYLVALHEFGHLLSPLAVRLWNQSEKVGGTDAAASTACEGAAWGWALDHVEPELLLACTTTALQHVQYGIMHHAQGVVRARRAALLSS